MLGRRSTTAQAATAQPMVPLGTLATLKYTAGPLTVNHSGQLPSVTLSFNLREGVSLGGAVETINKLARDTLPGTVSTNFQGTAQEFQSSAQELVGPFGSRGVCRLFSPGDSLRELYPSLDNTLRSSFAGLGALIALYVFNMDLSIYAFVGLIMLIGIVKKNAIMMIDSRSRRNETKIKVRRKRFTRALSCAFGRL